MNETLDKRVHILSSGLKVMRRQGYNGTGVKDIVDAAGVPKGSFYNYFDSKEAFAVEALRQVASGNLAQMRRILSDESLLPLQRLLTFFADHIDHLKRNGQFRGGCFIASMCQEMADTNEAIRRVAGGLLEDYQRAFIECLRDALATGELPAGLDAEALGAFLFAAWEGSLIRMKSSQSALPLEQFMSALEQILRFSGGSNMTGRLD